MENMLNRRGLRLEDIPQENCLYKKDGNSFPEKQTESIKGAKTYTIDTFLNDILPTCSNVKILLKNNHFSNMVTLTAPKSISSTPILNWDNNFDWVYNDDFKGHSIIRESVRSQGGGVDGYLRFSIMWAENNTDDTDLDAHCFLPGVREKIFYGNKKDHVSGGELDIDILHPLAHKRGTGKKVVENITFPRLHDMYEGKYQFKVHNYSERGNVGFKAEIEFNGKIYGYTYNQPVPSKKYVHVASVTLKDGSKFSIRHNIPTNELEVRDLYSLKTNHFHDVNVICLSPNQWKHNRGKDVNYFFLIDKAHPGKDINAINIDNLRNDSYSSIIEMENKLKENKIFINDESLSGIGFNKYDKYVYLKINSPFHQGIIKITF